MGCHPLLPERISMKLGIYNYTGDTTHVEIHVVLRQRGLGEHVTCDMLRFLIVQCRLFSFLLYSSARAEPAPVDRF